MGHNRFLLVAICMLLTLHLLLLFSHAGGAATKQLKLNTIVSSSTITLGQHVEIGCTVSNEGTKKVSLIPRRYPAEADYVDIVDRDGKRMKIIDKAIVDIGFTKRSFVELGPGENVRISLEAVLLKETLSSATTDQPPRHGIYIDFGDSATLLDSGANYLLQCKLRNTEDDRRLGEEYGIEAPWVGELVSDPVEIRLDLRTP